MIGCLCLISFSMNIHAQTSLEDNVSTFTSANGSLYLQPLADAFGANLNSGFAYDAHIPKAGLNVRVGVKLMGALISDDQKTFMSVAEEDVQANQTLPTVFGGEEPVEVVDIGASIGGVWETGMVPLIVPQLTVGSFMGTEVTLRWFEYEVDESIGRIDLLGYGGRHSISQYLPLCPVDIALAFFKQSLKVGDLVDASATSFGIQASKGFGILSVYGGFAYESASLDISYSYEGDNETTQIVFELDSANSTRMTLGLALNLTLLKIHADVQRVLFI